MPTIKSYVYVLCTVPFMVLLKTNFIFVIIIVALKILKLHCFLHHTGLSPCLSLNPIINDIPNKITVADFFIIYFVQGIFSIKILFCHFFIL